MAGDSTKKRKRDTSHKDASKTKKVSIQEPQDVTVHVSRVIRPKFSAPVIAATPGLSIPDTIEFDCYSKAEKKKKRKTSATPSSQNIVLHSADHRSMEYVGKEEKFLGIQPSLSHYIGIYDPATGQVELVEAKKMIIRGSVRSREAAPEDMEAPVWEQSNIERRNELGKAFGNKKTKRDIIALSQNAIAERKQNEDGSFQAAAMDSGDRALLESMKTAVNSMPTEAELRETAERQRPIPPGNFDAEEIQNVYIPEDIIGGDLLHSVPVREWQQASRAGEDIQLYSRYVAQRINSIALRDDALKKLQLLRYLYWLILYWQSARSGKERGTKRIPPRDKLKEAMDGAPESITEHFRRRFTDNGTIRRHDADRIMTHCCVFACIIDNFEVNMRDLREDLKLDKTQMNQYFVEIGARLRKVKIDGVENQIAKLSIPLRFPNTMRAIPRRRR